MILFNRFLGPVLLDVVVTEGHRSTLFVTKNPVEFGADVSDHAIVEPKRLTLEAVTASRPGGPAAIAAAWQALTAFQATRQPFTMVTALDVYRNMLIDSLDCTRDVDFGRVLYFRADLGEVIRVDTQSAPGAASGTTQSGLQSGNLQEGTPRDRGAPTVQRGNTATRPAATTEPRNLSAISGTFGGV